MKLIELIKQRVQETGEPIPDWANYATQEAKNGIRNTIEFWQEMPDSDAGFWTDYKTVNFDYAYKDDTLSEDADTPLEITQDVRAYINGGKIEQASTTAQRNDGAKTIKHVHEQTLHAFADGAKIQKYNTYYGDWVNDPLPLFSTRDSYRIDPHCAYAAYVINKYGEVRLALYKHWLSGGKVHALDSNAGTKMLLQSADLWSRPFEYFLEKCSKGYFLSKKKIAKVLWVRVSDAADVEHKWMDEDWDMKDDGWHKVPNCTREFDA